jgi:hypothetical protein
MTTGPSFEEYLVSKKIDSDAFKKAEPEVWKAWKNEFEQVHPNSFTVQKLNLINPVRRKYLLPATQEIKPTEPPTAVAAAPAPAKPGKPVMRPKPNRDSSD